MPDTDLLMAALGVVAALLVVGAYFCLESGRLKADDPRYYLMNGVSSIALIISIAHQFDMADSGAIVMEGCWLLISIKGLMRTWRSRRNAR